jgi:predicted membrane protein
MTGTPLPSTHPIFYIFPTNTCTEFFKHAAHSPFLSLQNAVYFIMLPFLVSVLFTFYIQGVLKQFKIFGRQKVKGLDRPSGLQDVEAPRFQDSRHMKVARLLALRTGCLDPQEILLVIISVRG